MGGWIGVEATPVEIVQRQRTIIVATMNYEAELDKERKEQQAEADRKHEALERELARRRGPMR